MKKLILSFIISLSFYTATAQEEKKETEQNSRVIKVYTPSGASSDGSNNEDTYKWAVKTDVLSYITGEFPIIGEYKVSKKISVEGSLGLTYAFIDNGLLSLYSLEEDDQFGETEAAIGTAFRASFKYFPSSDYDAIEGWYFGVQAFTKTNKRNYKDDTSSSNADFSGKSDVASKTGLSLIIGKQLFSDSNIIFDWYFGVGFAKKKREYYSSVYDSTTDIYEISAIEKSKSSPNIQLGLRIGFGN